jgi:hypothetical protein
MEKAFAVERGKAQARIQKLQEYIDILLNMV